MQMETTSVVHVVHFVATTMAHRVLTVVASKGVVSGSWSEPRSAYACMDSLKWMMGHSRHARSWITATVEGERMMVAGCQCLGFSLWIPTAHRPISGPLGACMNGP